MNRGSAGNLGDPIFMIETIYLDHSKFKVFTSESGFKAGLRAVKDDISRFGYGAQGYKTYELTKPQWVETKR